MATKNTTIHNKITGEKITWLETSQGSNGKRLVFLFEVAPKGKLPVTHYHPNQTETFEVCKGTFTVRLAGQVHILKAGEKLLIPKGVPHQWWNDSVNEPTKMKVIFEPALHTETFLEQFYGLSNDNKTAKDGTPAFLQLMAMVNEYEIYITGPPLFIQKALGFVLGGLAKLIGIKKYYPQYSKK
ncbi:cupin domain-containing protein [Xanthocytophaga agilis]|uniref:Cupin domain-containing protein n=1 Tax=Xanthocytophaga agilis TaxID=3048010 RepID=A0AAE3RDS3_9BACT|nr:cupin domain-containing protein [Xanthocytophaga agilis]MDJ1505928.1 cupin domain-containing protein [Xanthocytophaga agilis]